MKITILFDATEQDDKLEAEAEGEKVNPVTEQESMVIPGKVYEYLAVHKPIINITNLDAETAAIIQKCDSGKTFQRTMQKEIELYLEELVVQWQQQKTLTVGEEVISKVYSRMAITEELISILEEKQLFK